MSRVFASQVATLLYFTQVRSLQDIWSVDNDSGLCLEDREITQCYIILYHYHEP